MFSRLALVGLSVALAYSLTPDEWDKIWDKAEKKCEHLMKFSKSENSLPSIDDIPRRAKCFVSCFFDEVGLTNGTEINHELYMSWLEEELKHTRNKQAIIATVKKCIEGIEKTEKCKTAYELYECFGKKQYLIELTASGGSRCTKAQTEGRILMAEPAASAALTIKKGMTLLKCKAKYRVPSNDIESLKNRQMPHSREGKCMLTCILKKLNVVIRYKVEIKIQFFAQCLFLRPRGTVKRWISEQYKGNSTRIAEAHTLVDQCAEQVSTVTNKDCELATKLLECSKKHERRIKIE